jgi:PAS domain S-box-containing protein
MNVKDNQKTKEQLLQELKAVRNELRELKTHTGSYQQFEHELKESDKFYKTLFENTGTATILIEKDTTISMQNNDLNIGYTKDEIVGQSWMKFVAEDDVKRLLEYHNARRLDPDAAPQDYEFKIRRKDGSFVHILMTIAMIPGTDRSIGSMMDITKRFNEEMALRDSEERFRQLVESMNEGLCIQDERGTITYVNDSFCKILKLPRRQLIGRPMKQFISKWDFKNWMLKLRSKDATEPYELTFKGREGTSIYTLVSPRAMNDSQGNFTGGFAVVTDITERKQLEKEILNVSEQERQKISHELHDDLGQQLIGIEFMTKVLKNRLKRTSPDDTRYASEINQLVKESIKKTRRLARGLSPVYLVSHGLESSLEEIADSTSNIFGILCSFNCPRHVPIKDNSIATHLFYITKESIHNAIEHGKSTKISIDLSNNDDIVSLSIRDNGVGIQDVSQSFSGIGLRIMNYRARMIGASLQVESEPGGGTVVTCSFSLDGKRDDHR